MSQKIERDLLECLSTDTWKTRRVLSEMIGRMRRERGDVSLMGFLAPLFSKELSVLFSEPSIAALLVALDDLERRGLAEARRHASSPEELAARGGHHQNEWRLTQQGLRERNKRPARKGSKFKPAFA